LLPWHGGLIFLDQPELFVFLGTASAASALFHMSRRQLIRRKMRNRRNGFGLSRCFFNKKRNIRFLLVVLVFVAAGVVSLLPLAMYLIY